jgi:hypothetical protein
MKVIKEEGSRPIKMWTDEIEGEKSRTSALYSG